MARTLPHVEHGMLTVELPGAEGELRVDTLAWFGWLETATAFTCACPAGTFTARRERASSGRGGWYWRAYQRGPAGLRRVYLGKAAELTWERLQTVAASLTNASLQKTLDSIATHPPPPFAGAEAPTLPKGTVTFLLTDIEGSTQLWERYPQAMPPALICHGLLLQQAITDHGGVVFKTVGDGVYAAFATAPAALAAAFQAQQMLAAEDWTRSGLANGARLKVRMALHTGTAEQRDGDYLGPPLNRAARLLAAGHGSQVLLSAATAQLVRDQLPQAMSLRVLGTYQLPDLSQPEQIAQLLAPDLPATFPPLRVSGATAVDSRPQLLATKLYLPRSRPDLLARPRLYARLDTGLPMVLTLVCAPAGFGKTTLIAEWLAIKTTTAASTQSERSASPRIRASWVSLDAGDNDPIRFWSYVITALESLYPDRATGALALLQAQPTPPIDNILTILVTALSNQAPRPGAGAPDVLVLDDYHLIASPAIHQAVSFLIDHLPPQLHLIITTREDPPLALSRLRARSQLHELRAAQLRFTSDEVAALLIDMMGLPLTNTEITPLEQRTEGWAAGLQLAALALQDRSDYQSFLAAFTGSNRLVADYLIDEVFDRQPPHIQQFLIQTSILDRICGSLCDAVLGIGHQELEHSRHTFQSLAPDAYSQLILTELERANLFLVPLDDERRWYRYHHLFGEMLRHRLMRSQPTTVPDLYLRASAWFEREGLTGEAIEHAILARDFERAARLLDELGESARMRGELATLLRWLTELPDSVFEHRPMLALNHAFTLAIMDQFTAAERRLAAAERALLAAPVRNLDLLGQAAVVRSAIALQTDLPAEITIAAGQQALELLPLSNTAWRGLARLFLGVGYYAQAGDLSAAYQTLIEAERGSLEAGDPFGASNMAGHIPIVLEIGGRLRESEQISRERLRDAAEPFWQGVPLAAYARFGLGRVLYERNELLEARALLTEAIKELDAWALKRAGIIASVVMARVQQALGEPASAREWIGRAVAIVQKDDLKQTFSEWAAYRARIALAQGDLQSAAQWAQEIEPTISGELKPVLEFKHITLALVFLAQQRLDDAERLLERLLPAAEAAGRNGRVLEIRLLQALAADARGRRTEALTILERVLILAAPEGYVRIFVDAGAPMAALLTAAYSHRIMPEYVAKILAVFEPGSAFKVQEAPISRHSSDPRPLSLIAEPLTARELEVLRLLTEGASNSAIAQALVISLGTTKKHINNIFGKLGVQSRIQAAAKARELALI